MISQKRLSRGLEKPVDGEAVKAASVIGKAMNHNGKVLGQNNHFRAPASRSGSLMGNRNNSNNNQVRRTFSMTGSRQSSLRSPSMNSSSGAVRTRSVMRSDPRQKDTGVSRSYSLTVPKRNVTQQDAQSAFDEFGGPQHRGVIHRSPSVSSIPKGAKTVRKYVPSAKGLIAIDVPVEEAQQQEQLAQQQIQRNRSLTRSNSRNYSLTKNNSRTNSLTGSRTNSLTGPRSVSLNSARTNSIRRSSSRTSSLTGSKPNLQPPKRYSSLTSASLVNGSRRDQFMSTPLEEEEEDVKPPVRTQTKPGQTKPGQMNPGQTKFGQPKPGQTKPGQTKFGQTVSGNSTVSPRTVTTKTVSKKPLGAPEPSGRAKTIPTVKNKVPTTVHSTERAPLHKPLSSSSPPASETSDLSMNHHEKESHEQAGESQDTILEDEREDHYDDSGNRLWDDKLENVIKQGFEDGPQQATSTSTPVSSPTPVENSKPSILPSAPAEEHAKQPIPQELQQQMEKKAPVTKGREYESRKENENDEDYKPQEHKNLDEPKPQGNHREDSSNREGIHDQSEKTPAVTVGQVNDKTTAVSQPPVNESSQNRLKDYLQGEDEQLENSGIESVASDQNPNESLVQPLKISSRESPQADTSTSAQEDELAKEVRQELDIMGHNSSNDNSDQNSDDLFVDSREDILDDFDANGNQAGRKVPSLPERNPKRGNGNKAQADGGVLKTTSPIKSALKKTTSENSNPSMYTESSPANQAYLSLTTAENTRLNAQLTGSDTIPRKSSLKSINRSRTMLNNRATHSLSPPPREALVPKRHSHHVGNKTSADRKATGTPPARSRNSMLNAPSRSQKPLKGESSNSAAKSKLNNPILYPREPPQKRSSFEKTRNKDNNVGMSKLSLRDGALLENNYQQSSLDNHFRGATAAPSVPSSGTENGNSTALFSSSGFKSRFQDSDSEDEGLPVNGVGGKPDQQANATNSNGNGFSLFKHKDSGESEGFGKKLGKLSLKSSNGSDQGVDYSTTKRFGNGGGVESKVRTLRDEIPADNELADGGKKNAFGKKLKKLFGRHK
ncbi:hypothetical protein ZYGR_0Z01330 [Zygosaccharomyces rouxii]|uniref:Eisosome protein SEG1 n=1 Tax=Zygosaccharomyces rouxii TaxID=4956 RepID=A0A1Q3A558_ZYGRO|nr:hypothetical protein ZYGR_0Z01330 [Zygosaccharomyces rouxii]